MKFALPPDVELTVELDEAPLTSLYLEQGTDMIQIPPKHIPAICKALYQAHDTWRANQPVRRSTSPLFREPPTDGEA